MKGRMLSTHDRISLIVENIKKYEGNYLEIGCYHGLSLCAVAGGAPRTICHGIDPFLGDVATHPDLGVENSINGERVDFSQDHPLYENIKHFPNIEFFEMTTEKFMDSLTEHDIERMNITSFYIDGCHHYKYVLYDAKSCLKLLNNKNGFMLFDDMHNEEVQSAYSDFIFYLKEKGINYEELSGFIEIFGDES